MTGPEHYREAEDLLNQPWQDETHATLFIAQAQVHATLALAAATAILRTQEADSIHNVFHDFSDWYKVAGEQVP